MKGLTRFALALMVIGMLFSTACFSPRLDAAPAFTPEQADVEQELAQLKQEITEIQAELDNARQQFKNEQEKLRELDLQMQQTAIRLRKLASRIAGHQHELANLEVLKNDQLADLNRGQEQLAEQLDSTYRLARQSRIKLILNQDSPAELSRLLGYHERINAVQVQKIQRLRKLLDELNKTVAAISIELSAVEQAQKEQQSIRNEQAEQVLQREALIASLSTQISGEESRLKELRQNQEDLEKLLQRLTDVLADIPANLGRQLGVSEQKGHLPMPAKGPVKHGFGQSRSGTMSWQGWVIDVSRGTEVAAVAYGRVAFADWLRGYGLLMIIDHGDGFMTLYGYNESLLWDVGDWVEPGAVIATAGNSPGGEYGLYFELRKEGRALDPAAWIKR